MATRRAWSVIVLPALLLAGIAAATLGFARSTGVPLPPPNGQPTHASGRPFANAPGGDEPRLFRRKADELEARLARAPSDRDAVLELARLLHDGHRAADAIPLYRRALALAPGDAHVAYDLASAHGELGEWEEAAAVLGERLDDHPGEAVTLFDLGAVRANQERVQEARLYLEAAREATTDGALLARISQALARLKAS